MADQCGPIGRRQTLAGLGAAGLGAAGVVAAAPTIGAAQTKVAPITIVINQSPWFDSFRKTVELYEKETGNKVELDVNPFAGSLEKQRNSVRAAPGPVRPPDHEFGLVRRDVFRRLRRADQRHRSRLQARPGDLHARRHGLLRSRRRRPMTPAGKLMSMPISPLIPMLYYRGDLYKEAGLKAPETFAELEANARKFHKPPRHVRHRPARRARPAHASPTTSTPTSTATAAASSRTRRPATTRVMLNSAEGKHGARLLHPARHARPGIPKTAALDQAEVIQNMVTGKAAHIMMVIAAWSQMDDPTKSAVVDKVEFAPTPHVPGVPPAPGPRPLARRRRAERAGRPQARRRRVPALVPDQGRADGDREGRRHPGQRRRLPRADRRGAHVPLDEAAGRRRLPHAVNIYQFPEASEVIAILELGLNRAIAGEITSVARPQRHGRTRSTP